jgi:hypothetical protein
MIIYNIIMFVALWLVCGLYASAKSFAYFQGKYTLIAKESYYKDIKWCLGWGVGFGIIAFCVSLFMAKGYGLKFR